jgi:DNA-binding Lrp family transcriptional regulator
MIITNQVTAVQARILKELIADGRKTETEIAKKTGSKKEFIKKNYARLEEMGIITGATVHINYKSFGYKAVAHILINVNPQQADQLTKSLQEMPEIYSVHSRDVKGNIGVIATLRSLEQLNEIKDKIKREFSIVEMKTAIWTDVKEMNENLSIVTSIKGKKTLTQKKTQETTKKESNPKSTPIDVTNQRIADQLAINGRASMEEIGKAIGVSPDTVKKRYEKLKDNGDLKVTIQINPNKLGYQALCIFFVAISNENISLVINKIIQIPDVISIMKITGDYDLEIYAMARDIGQLLSIKEELGNMSGVAKIEIEISRIGEELCKWPTPRQYISTF